MDAWIEYIMIACLLAGTGMFCAADSIALPRSMQRGLWFSPTSAFVLIEATTLLLRYAARYSFAAQGPANLTSI